VHLGEDAVLYVDGRHVVKHAEAHDGREAVALEPAVGGVAVHDVYVGASQSSLKRAGQVIVDLDDGHPRCARP
jgi:hypothetical protein